MSGITKYVEIDFILLIFNSKNLIEYLSIKFQAVISYQVICLIILCLIIRIIARMRDNPFYFGADGGWDC